MKMTLIYKVAVPKTSSVYDDNFNNKTITCSTKQLVLALRTGHSFPERCAERAKSGRGKPVLMLCILAF